MKLRAARPLRMPAQLCALKYEVEDVSSVSKAQIRTGSISFQHWGIPLSRRFRSLKLWFVIRNYGVTGLQSYIREHCRLAKVFEEGVLSDKRFEVCNKVKVGSCLKKAEFSVSKPSLRWDIGKLKFPPPNVLLYLSVITLVKFQGATISPSMQNPK